LTEQLAKAINLFIQQATHGFRRAVACSKPCAASDQHHLHLILGNPGRDLGTDFIQVILEQHPSSQVVPGITQAVDKDLARSIGFESPGITDGQNGDI